MKKVNIIGERAWHVFEDSDGNLVTEKCTIEQYNALALKNPTNPTKQGYKWHHSWKDWKYDTPSGALEDGCYAVEPGRRVLSKKIGQPQKNDDNLATFLAKEAL